MDRDFFAVVRGRRSIRAFLPQPIAAAELQAILEAARRAPSAGNLQSWEIAQVEDRALLERLARAAAGQEFLAQAPLALVFSALPMLAAAKYGGRGATLYALQDATIACAYAQLAAAALGLGSVWVGAFDAPAVHALIGARPAALPVAILPIGHPAAPGEESPRKPLEQLVRRV